MTVKSNFPEIRPSLNLDFANVKALDPRITFTRTTTATYYDGKTTAKAEENLLLQSEDFTTTWANQEVVRTVNTEVAPNGTTTADTLESNSNNTSHGVYQAISFVSGQTYTLSMFFKKGTGNYAQLRFFSAIGGAFANFDLDTGVVGTTGKASGNDPTSTITSFGNGWYRCSITVAVNATASAGGGMYITTSASASGAEAHTSVLNVFAWGAQLEQRSAVSAYTPTTTQPITNYIPVLQTAASGVARFDHNPTTGESLGLLVEEQRTNLLTYSAEFDNAAWTKTNSSITANTIVAPDGTLTGDKLVEDTSASATHNLQRSSSVTSGTSYTFSVYAKAAERTLIRISGGAAGFGSNEIQFNLSAGTATVTNGTPTASIVSVGNNWYRCAWTAVATASTTPNFFVYLDNGSAITYTGDGYSGIYIWGAQLEAGAFPTSYIPTTSATVTRNADVASMTGTNFSSWYRADEGTIYSEVAVALPNSGSNQFVARSSANDYGNTVGLNITSGGYASLPTSSGGVFDGVVSSVTTLTANVFAKVAGGYATNNLGLSLNGATVVTDLSATIPTTPNRLDIGSDQLGLNRIKAGHVRKLAYYPSRLSNAQLQALTT